MNQCNYNKKGAVSGPKDERVTRLFNTDYQVFTSIWTKFHERNEVLCKSGLLRFCT